MNEAETMERVALFSALRRIGRKAWPQEHKLEREFIVKDEQRGGRHDAMRVTVCDTEQTMNPQYRPTWAKAENNPCDCSKCIALRVLAEVKAEWEVSVV